MDSLIHTLLVRTAANMKEIVIRRNRENFNMMRFQVVIDNKPFVTIDNGETKRVEIETLPVKLFVKQGWMRSREIEIDDTTSEIGIRSAKVKSRIAPIMGGLLLLILFLPDHIIADSQTIRTVTIAGLVALLAWTIYALIIKSNDWILIDKKDQQKENG